LLLSAGSARAEIPNALRGRPIIGVRVAGDSAQLVSPDATGIPLGEPLDRSVVRAAINKLLASGRWVDVQVEAEAAVSGVVLIFRLEPRINLRRIEVRGNDQLDEQQVRDALGLADGAEVRVDALPQLEAAVRNAYAERGYLGASVQVELRDTDDPSQKVLLVEVDEGAATRIVELSFRGDQPPAPARVFAAMGLGVGDVLNRRQLSAARLRGAEQLREQRFLEAHIGNPVISFRRDGARLTFPLHLGPQYTLEVRGATPLKDTEVANAVMILDAPLTAEAIDAMPAHIKDLYAKNGFLHARASVSRSMIGPGRARLLARIDPGLQVDVVSVSFSGALFFRSDFLREQLFSYLDEDLPGGGLVRAVDSQVAADALHGDEPVKRRVVPRPQEQEPSRTYYEPTYVEAIKHITELYQAAGFLSVQVGPPVLREIEPGTATVNVPVVEGPRTLLHRVVIAGQERVTTQELLITSGLLRGAPFSYLVLEEARVRMQELYRERGHIFVRIEPSVRFSNDRTRAEVSFQIIEGFPVRISEIVVRGAERTSKSFILGLLSLKPGDLFRPSKARESERTLSTLGVMSSASLQLEDPDLPARSKRLLVIVAERSNQFLDFGAGLSTGEGARLGFDYGYRNLFGRAVGLTLRVQFAYQVLLRPDLRERFDRLLFAERLERNIALGLVIPRTPGLGATRTNLDLVHVRDNERDFGLDKNGVTLAFTEIPFPRVTVLEAADLENNNIDLFTNQSGIAQLLAENPDPRVQRLLRVPEGNTTLVALRLSVSYDRRDNAFVPTRGFFVSIASEAASTLHDTVSQDAVFFSRFLKLQFTGNGYIPIGRSIVLAGQLRVGRILPLQPGSRTYPNRAFFLGGVETLRGYYEDELIPQDVADAAYKNHTEEQTRTSVVRSGDAFVLLRGEVRFPIYGPLGGGLFADFGNLWSNAANMNPLDLRPTAGAGLRLSTPVGPIAVDYGIVLQRRVGLAEPFGTLHFSIGLF
jgi:outer membrane protein assembly factor BamA